MGSSESSEQKFVVPVRRVYRIPPNCGPSVMKCNYPRNDASSFDDMFDAGCLRTGVNRTHFSHVPRAIRSLTDVRGQTDFGDDKVETDSTKAMKYRPKRNALCRSKRVDCNVTEASKYTRNEFGEGSNAIDSVSKHCQRGKSQFG